MAFSDLSDSDNEVEVDDATWETKVMTFGKYDSCKLIARGGMGATFRVVKKADLSQRCVKLSLDSSDDSLREDWVLKSFKSIHFDIEPYVAVTLEARDRSGT